MDPEHWKEWMAILSSLVHCSLSCFLPPLHSKPASLPFLKHSRFWAHPVLWRLLFSMSGKCPHPLTPNPCPYSQNSFSLLYSNTVLFSGYNNSFQLTFQQYLLLKPFIFPLIGSLVSPSNSMLHVFSCWLIIMLQRKNSTLAEISDNFVSCCILGA